MGMGSPDSFFHLSEAAAENTCMWGAGSCLGRLLRFHFTTYNKAALTPHDKVMAGGEFRENAENCK